MEVIRLLRRIDDLVGELEAAFAALSPDFRQRDFRAELIALLLDEVELFLRIRRESVDGDDSRQAELMDVLDVFRQVGEALLERCHVDLAELLLVEAAVHLERADRRDDDNSIRLEAGEAALDVEEFLGTEVGTEACFRDDVVGELQRELRRHDAVAAMGDVRERASVDEGRRALERLHEVRLDGILEEQRQSTRDIEFFRADGAALTAVADDDLTEALLHVLEVLREAEDGHHLRGHRDVEARLTRRAMCLAAEADNDVTQGAIIEVEHALPRDAAHVDVECITLLDVVVDDSREQVVRRRDGVEVAREVQVDVLHRHDLRVAAAGSTALEAKAGAERRLAQRDGNLLALTVEGVSEADARRRLALAGRRRVDSRHEDELAIRLLLDALPSGKCDFCLVLAVELELIIADTELLRDLLDRAHLGFLCNLNIGFHFCTSCIL